MPSLQMGTLRPREEKEVPRRLANESGQTGARASIPRKAAWLPESLAKPGGVSDTESQSLGVPQLWSGQRALSQPSLLLPKLSSLGSGTV